MSSSHRRENPSRSAAEPSSRHRNYRFKSYLEANTQERARFDSMQDHVPDKIAEVIASFREEKLTVHPHRPQVAGAAADVGQRVDMPRPRPRSVAVAPAVAGRRRPAWHWYLGALGLAFALMIWLDTRADVDRTPALPLVASNSGSELTTTPGYDTSAHVDAAAMSGGMSTGAITAAPASVVVPLEPSARPAPAPAPVKMAAAPQRKKPAPAKVRNTKDEVHHYSEDLTGLLQGP